MVQTAGPGCGPHSDWTTVGPISAVVIRPPRGDVTTQVDARPRAPAASEPQPNVKIEHRRFVHQRESSSAYQKHSFRPLLVQKRSGQRGGRHSFTGDGFFCHSGWNPNPVCGRTVARSELGARPVFRNTFRLFSAHLDLPAHIFLYFFVTEVPSSRWKCCGN